MRYRGFMLMCMVLCMALPGCARRHANQAFHDGAQAMAIEFTAEYRRQQEGRLLRDAHRCPRFQPVLADLTIPGGLQGEVFVPTQTIPVVVRGAVLHPDCLKRVR